jgi:hypothetical protein
MYVWIGQVVEQRRLPDPPIIHHGTRLELSVPETVENLLHLT